MSLDQTKIDLTGAAGSPAEAAATKLKAGQGAPRI